MIAFFKNLLSQLHHKTLDPVQQTALNHFAAHYKQAEAFLKSRRSQQQDSTLAALPKVLLIGEKGVGKTSLLAHAGVPFIFSKSLSTQQLATLPETAYCDWFVSQKRAYLDLNGDIFSKTDPLNQQLWQRLLSLLKKTTPKLQAVLFTIDIEILLSPDTNTKIDTMMKQLQSALSSLGRVSQQPLPLYLVFTKLDKITGFREFFNELNECERKQVWGFRTNHFEKDFSDLIKRLHTRAITHLHHEHQLERRARIQEFPLLLSALKPQWQALFSQLQVCLAALPHVTLKQSFLCSALQKDTPTTQSPHRSADTFALTVPPPKQSLSNKAFFCFDLIEKQLDEINQCVSVQQTHRAVERHSRLKKAITLSSVLLLFGVTISFAHVFKQDLKHITQVEACLTRYDLLKTQLATKTQPTLAEFFKPLASVREANTLLAQLNLPWLFERSNPALKQIKFKTQMLYDDLLRTRLAPRLSALLIEHLKSDRQATQIYGSLKTYRLLTDAKQMDLPYLQHWFTHQTSDLSDTEKTGLCDDLVHLIDDLHYQLSDASKGLALQAAHRLRRMDKADLAYAILKNQTDNQFINPFTPTQMQALSALFHIDLNALLIEKLFTHAGYQELYRPNLEKIVQAALAGDWVTGPYPLLPFEKGMKESITQTLTETYLSDYQKTWIALAQAFQLQSANTFAEQLTQLELLSGNHSPLKIYLDVIHQNTQIGHENLLPALASLNKNTDGNISKWMALDEAFSNLYWDLKTVQSAQDKTQASFDYVRHRLEGLNHASAIEPASDPLSILNRLIPELPMPLQAWIQQMTHAVWHPLMQEAESDIRAKWQTDVFAWYDTQLSKRYPFELQSSEDVSLADFTQFFSPNGTLDSFYQHYLAPFIQTVDDHWYWQLIDGESLQLSDNFLSQIRRGLIIKTMFFAGKESNLRIPFQLKTLSLEPIVKSMQLTLDNQPATFTQTTEQAKSFLWPAMSKQASGLDLTFKAITGRSSHLHLAGDWALFRLLNRANLAPTQDPRTFNMTLDLNGYAAEVALLADNDFNPFIPHILDGFKCEKAF